MLRQSLLAFLTALCAQLVLASQRGSLPSSAPRRIASGTVGSDEIIYTLLEKKNELSRLIAVSIFAEDPRYSSLPKLPSTVQGRVGNSLEALLALKPDFAILANYNKEEIAPQLRAAGVRVSVQENFRSLDDVLNNIRSIGDLIGTEKEASDLIAHFQTKLNSLEKLRVSCPKDKQPQIVQYSDQNMLPGTETIFDDVVQRAGFINLASKAKIKGWATLSDEILLGFDPDWVVVEGDPARYKEILGKVQQQATWNKLNAIKAGRLIIIPNRLLYSVSQNAIELIDIVSKKRTCRS